MLIPKAQLAITSLVYLVKRSLVNISLPVFARRWATTLSAHGVMRSNMIFILLEVKAGLSKLRASRHRSPCIEKRLELNRGSSSLSTKLKWSGKLSKFCGKKFYSVIFSCLIHHEAIKSRTPQQIGNESANEFWHCLAFEVIKENIVIICRLTTHIWISLSFYFFTCWFYLYCHSTQSHRFLFFTWLGSYILYLPILLAIIIIKIKLRR